jgi:DNA modification methylase
MPTASLYTGDAKHTLASLPAESVQTCVTSPPYWGLRDYGEDGQLGLEETPEEYVQNLVDVFREVRRVLRDDGTVWLNIGDSYARPGAKGDNSGYGKHSDYVGDGLDLTNRTVPSGLKEKDLTMIPSRVAMALQEDGWWVRSRIVWAKGNPMPESVTDRPTSSHEYIFLLSKSKQYYYDADAVAEESITGDTRKPYAPGRVDHRGNGHDRGGGEEQDRDGSTRNKRDVWQVNTKPFPDAHFAVYPPELIEPCVKAGSAEKDTVLDPFSGAGTTGVVALAKGRDYIGIDLSRDYNEMAADRIRQDAPLMNEVQIKEPVAA